MKYDRNFPILSLEGKQPLVDFAQKVVRGLKPLETLEIDWPKLDDYIQKVSERYKDNPYHNFHHAVDTLNTMAWFLDQPVLKTQIPPLDQLILLIGSLVHDVEHPGLDNNWEINIRSNRALRYDNRAVLENHSASVALSLLSHKKLNFLHQLPLKEQDRARELLLTLVLATDFSRHRTFLDLLAQHTQAGLQFDQPEQLTLLECSLIKATDISNPGKHYEEAKAWAQNVIQEFFSQGQLEKANNLPVGFLNDQEKVELNAAQAGFIKMQVIDLFRLLAKVEPALDEVVDQLAQNQAAYEAEAQQIQSGKGSGPSAAAAVNQKKTSAR